MRICLLNWYANRSGGADVYTEALAVGLARRGHAVEVVCYDASPEVEAVCQVRRLTKRNYRSWPIVWRLSVFWQWWDVEQQIAKAGMVRPDVIIGSPLFSYRAMARKFPQVPRVYLPHARISPVEVEGYDSNGATGLFRRLVYELYYRLERWALQTSGTTVRFTKGNAELIAAFYRLPATVRFDVLPQAVNVPETSAQRNSTGPVRLLFIGRLMESKNVAFLVRSLDGNQRQDWRLDIVGDGPERSVLERQVRDAGLQESVVFHGQQDDVDRFYRDADLFVFPSRLENLSLVVLEAMAYGLPVIAMRSDGTRYLNATHEVMTHDGEGLLAANEADFQRYVQEAISEPGCFAKLGTAARLRVQQNHRWEAVLDRWQQLLTELTTAKQPRTRNHTVPVCQPDRPCRSVSMAPNVWIVLVDYNGLEDTRKCLRSLMGQSTSAQTIVVDNASHVDVTEALKAEFSWAHLIRSTTNGGWAGGNNIGMKYAMKQGADLVILLNNDTVVDAEFVTRLVAAANAYPEFGIIGPVIRFMDPPYEVQTDGVQFNRPDKPGFFQRQEVKLTTVIPPKVVEVDIVNGCCLMVSRKVVEAIGSVDEEFFLIHEESDFCLRSQAAGFKNGVLAEALVWHKGSSTFKREGSRLQRYYDARNLVRLIHKHGHRAGSRGTWRSYMHHLRYSYHRYAIERDGNFTDSANAVLEGLYDAALGRWGQYRKDVRLGLSVLRGMVSLAWRLASKSPVAGPILHPKVVTVGPPPPS